MTHAVQLSFLEALTVAAISKREERGEPIGFNFTPGPECEPRATFARTTMDDWFEAPERRWNMGDFG